MRYKKWLFAIIATCLFNFCTPDKKGKLQMANVNDTTSEAKGYIENEMPFSKSLTEEQLKLKYDIIKIDSTIGTQSAFLYMEKSYEPYSFTEIYENKDTISPKASSSVKLIELMDGIDAVKIYDELTCRATLAQDILQISLRYSTGFTGAGVNIEAVGNSFQAIPYEFTDNIDVNVEEDIIIAIDRQKLILNKPKYKTGDKVFGYIYLRALRSDSTRFYAQGFFCAKIGEKRN